jgi:uncharacterized membrane protein
MQTALAVSLQVVMNRNCNSFHNSVVLFSILVIFLFFTSLKRKFIWLYDILLGPWMLFTSDLSPAEFFQPWQAWRHNCALP